MEIQWIGCPDSNFRRGRPFGLRPEAVVIHIMDGSFAAGESVFRNPLTQKSAHYGISRAGVTHQYVDENDSAFHAGIVVNPSWHLLKPRVNPNFYTIGIEHEGRPDDILSEAELLASARLLGEICARWGISLDEDHVIRHHQIRASKSCPGNTLKIGELLQRVANAMALSAGAGPSFSVTGSAVAASAVVAPRVAVAVSSGPVAPEAHAAIVRTIRSVNLRRSRPSTAAQIVRTIPANTEVAIRGFQNGDTVNGNARWYVDLEGNFLWSGATDVPDPRE